MTDSQSQALIDASLGIAKRRFGPNFSSDRSAKQPLQPCWCETTGLNCIGQPQCHAASNAINEIQRARR